MNKHTKKYPANCLFLLLATVALMPAISLQAMAPKKYNRQSTRRQTSAKVDQFNLVITMGIWDQALAILDGTKSRRAKTAYLLGDRAQDDEVDSNLHQAALRAPLVILKKFVAHAQTCGIDLPNLFVYGQNEDGRPLRLSVLDLAHSREHDRELAIAYLKKEAFPDSSNN